MHHLQYTGHHNGDLGYTYPTHSRLVEENSSKVISIREAIGLVGQVQSSRIDQVYARQPVLLSNLLCSQMLLDSQRIVCSAFPQSHRSQLSHTLRPPHCRFLPPHPRPGRPRHRPRGAANGRQFQKWSSRIDQRCNPISGQHLAPSNVFLSVRLRSALADFVM